MRGLLSSPDAQLPAPWRHRGGAGDLRAAPRRAVGTPAGRALDRDPGSIFAAARLSALSALRPGLQFALEGREDLLEPNRHCARSDVLAPRPARSRRRALAQAYRERHLGAVWCVEKGR